MCKSDKVRERTRRQEWQACQSDKMEIKKDLKNTSDKRVKVTEKEGDKKRIKHKREASHFNEISWEGKSDKRVKVKKCD